MLIYLSIYLHFRWTDEIFQNDHKPLRYLRVLPLRSQYSASADLERGAPGARPPPPPPTHPPHPIHRLLQEFRESLHFRTASIDAQTKSPPVYLQHILGMSTDPRHVISIRPRQPEVPREAGFCSGNSPILNHHLNSSQYLIRKYTCFKFYICIWSQGMLSISSHSLSNGRVLLEYKMYQILKKKNISICPYSPYRGRGSLK